jgi:hypothetical protein
LKAKWIDENLREWEQLVVSANSRDLKDVLKEG